MEDRSGAAANYVGYANPVLDKLIDQQAVQGKDPEARKRLLQDVQRAVISDAIYLPLHLYQQPTLTQPNVRDYFPPCQVNNHNLYWTTVWFD